MIFRLPRGPVGPVVLAGMLALITPAAAQAGGKLAWLDEVVQQAVREARQGGDSLALAEARSVGRLFVREADDSLETLARRADDLARAAGKLDDPAEAALRSRFGRVVGRDAELARTFSNLAPAEKR